MASTGRVSLGAHRARAAGRTSATTPPHATHLRVRPARGTMTISGGATVEIGANNLVATYTDGLKLLLLSGRGDRENGAINSPIAPGPASAPATRLRAEGHYEASMEVGSTQSYPSHSPPSSPIRVTYHRSGSSSSGSGAGGSDIDSADRATQEEPTQAETTSATGRPRSGSGSSTSDGHTLEEVKQATVEPHVIRHLTVQGSAEVNIRSQSEFFNETVLVLTCSAASRVIVHGGYYPCLHLMVDGAAHCELRADCRVGRLSVMGRKCAEVTVAHAPLELKSLSLHSEATCTIEGTQHTAAETQAQEKRVRLKRRRSRADLLQNARPQKRTRMAPT